MYLLDTKSLELRYFQNHEEVPYAILSHTWADDEVMFQEIEDVPNNGDRATQEEKLRRSRCFTRGWTLQELIAPANLEFYGAEWHSQGQGASLGTKLSLQDEISSITGIPVGVLWNIEDRSCCNAQKMSWAAGRKTSRVEDKAYCLMGLFDVNMPLLYGEGSRAFIRLQEEIMKRTDDESLFAWKIGESSGSKFPLFRGLLATSPDDFAYSGGITQEIHSHRTTPFPVTNRGIQIGANLVEASYLRTGSTASNVSFLHFFKVYNGIPLKPLDRTFYHGQNSYTRFESGALVYIDLDAPTLSENQKEIFVIKEASYVPLNQAGYINSVFLKTTPNNFDLIEAEPPMDSWVTGNGENILDLMSTSPRFFATLKFYDGVDEFRVAFGLGILRPWIHVYRESPNWFPTETNKILNKHMFVDRCTYKLQSGRVISVSRRPQRITETPLYALNISVSS